MGLMRAFVEERNESSKDDKYELFICGLAEILITNPESPVLEKNYAKITREVFQYVPRAVENFELLIQLLKLVSVIFKGRPIVISERVTSILIITTLRKSVQDECLLVIS